MRIASGAGSSSGPRHQCLHRRGCDDIGGADEIGNEAGARTVVDLVRGSGLNDPSVVEDGDRSAIESASPWSWVTKTKVMPSERCRLFSSSCICSRSFRSSAPSGSSSSSTFGLFTSARQAPRAAAGRRRAAGLAGAVAGELDHLQCLFGFAVALGLGHALDHQAIGDVVENIEVREEGIVLEDRVDVAAIGRHALGGFAEDLDMAKTSAARSRQSGAGRSSCRSRRAEHGEEFTWLDPQVDGIDGFHAAEMARDLREGDGCGHGDSSFDQWPLIRLPAPSPRSGENACFRRLAKRRLATIRAVASGQVPSPRSRGEG